MAYFSKMILEKFINSIGFLSLAKKTCAVSLGLQGGGGG